MIEFRCRDHPTRLLVRASRWVELEELDDEDIAYEPYSPVEIDRDGVNRVLAQCPTCGRTSFEREVDIVAELRRLTPGPEGRRVVTHLV